MLHTKMNYSNFPSFIRSPRGLIQLAKNVAIGNLIYILFSILVGWLLIDRAAPFVLFAMWAPMQILIICASSGQANIERWWGKLRLGDKVVALRDSSLFEKGTLGTVEFVGSDTVVARFNGVAAEYPRNLLRREYYAEDK